MALTQTHSLIAVAIIATAICTGVLVFIFIFNDHLDYAPTIRLPQGRVRGIVQTADDGKVFLYQGVRFARAERFQKAKLVPKISDDKNDEIYDAIKPRDNCPQLGIDNPQKTFTSLTYSEDCLYLNIWQRMEPRTNRSVMVYFFGGRFSHGSIFEGIHDGRYIAYRGDVIVVTVNYRLNAFGFLAGSTGGNSSFSNLGLHDQIVGLKWIKENIAHFGGNPDSVTIFGNSAGSMAVSALLLSPLTTGLFSKAILQSGVVLKVPIAEETFGKVREIAKHLPGCDVKKQPEVEDLLKSCLLKCTTDELLNATRDSGVSFGPVYGDEFLPESPLSLLTSGRFNSNVQLLYGTVQDEGFGLAIGPFPELNNDTLSANLTVSSTRNYIEKLIGDDFGFEAADFYIRRANFSENPSLNELRQIINQAYGDFSMICPSFLFSEAFITSTLSSNLGHFSWLLTRPAAVHIMGSCKSGWAAGTVCHADDLYSLFTISRQTKEEDRKLSKDIVGAWVRFAVTGSPGRIGNVQWTEAVKNKSSSSLMALDYTFKMRENVHKETCNDFWKLRIFT